MQYSWLAKSHGLRAHTFFVKPIHLNIAHLKMSGTSNSWKTVTFFDFIREQKRYNAIMRGYVNPERFALPLYEEQSQAEKSTCQVTGNLE